MLSSQIEQFSQGVNALIDSHPTIVEGSEHALHVRGLRDSLFDALDILDQSEEALPEDPNLDIRQHVVFTLSVKVHQGRHPAGYVHGYLEGIGLLRTINLA